MSSGNGLIDDISPIPHKIRWYPITGASERLCNFRALSQLANEHFTTLRDWKFLASYELSHTLRDVSHLFHSFVVASSLFRIVDMHDIQTQSNAIQLSQGVLRGSVVECLSRNPDVLGSSLTGSSGFFRGSVLGQATSEAQPGETQQDVNNVNCRRDMTEILLKAA